MRSLLTFLSILLAVPAMSQLNCSNVNAAISLSASGGVVTLTNSSVPTATSNIYTTYTIKWGDNTTTYAYNNSNQVHTYNTSGTYTVTLYQNVLDSMNNISCNDTATANITVTTSLNCNNVHAAMQTYVSGGSTGVLVNSSTPVAGPKLSVQYQINWGDGSSVVTTSSKSNQTHVYTNSGTYAVKLQVTAYDSNNNITCVDTATSNLTIGSTTLNCANVNAAFGKSIVNNTVTIINNSVPNPGSGINASYTFKWGNGQTTTKTNKTNTSYTYSTSGTYTIWLVATYTSGSVTCRDSVSDTVNINIQQPNYISGYVMMDSNSLSSTDSVKIWLIKFDSATNLLTAVDSQTRHAYVPYYSFGNRAAGIYRTKAKLLNGQTSGTGYVPTYHDSSLVWSSATLIYHTGGATGNRHIYMRKGTVTGGPGFVAGNVTQGANKGTASGIEGMNILLLDANHNPVAFAVTDASGNYSFNNLPLATYKIHPEDMNYATTEASLNVTAVNTSHTGINFERSMSQKTIVPVASGITNVNSSELAFGLYPNPAKTSVTLAWANLSDDKATVTITDISGKKVAAMEVKMNANATIGVDKLTSGLYFLNISTAFGNSTRKLVIE